MADKSKPIAPPGSTPGARRLIGERWKCKAAQAALAFLGCLAGFKRTGACFAEAACHWS